MGNSTLDTLLKGRDWLALRLLAISLPTNASAPFSLGTANVLRITGSETVTYRETTSDPFPRGGWRRP